MERPILISTPHPFAGAKRAECCVNPAHIVYEDPRNLEIVRQMDGFVVCVACALELKGEYPDFNVKGQMWEGAIREPKPVAPWNIFLDLLNKPKP